MFILAWWLLPAAFLLTGCGVIMFVWMWEKGIFKEVFSRKPQPKKKKKAQRDLRQLAEDLKPPEKIPEVVPVIPIPSIVPAPILTPKKLMELEALGVKEGFQIEIIEPSSFGRAIIREGKVFLQPRTTQKDIFTFDYKEMTYYINIALLQQVVVKGKPVLKLIYNILYSEPYNADGTITWDQGFEDILTDDAMDQYIRACTFEGKFELTRNVVILVAVIFFFMLPIGIVINAGTSIIPGINVHWLPVG